MKTLANYSTDGSNRPQGWLPAPTTVARALAPQHWQSRAARGFTWNRDGAMQRRRPH